MKEKKIRGWHCKAGEWYKYHKYLGKGFCCRCGRSKKDVGK